MSFLETTYHYDIVQSTRTYVVSICWRDPEGDHWFELVSVMAENATTRDAERAAICVAENSSDATRYRWRVVWAKAVNP